VDANQIAEELERNWDRNVREAARDLTKKIPWTLFCTLTFKSEVIAEKTAQEEFRALTDGIKEMTGIPPSWTLFPELQKRDALHYHAVLADVPIEYSRDIEELWLGNPLVEPFDPCSKRRGINYITKAVNADTDWMFGGPRFPGRGRPQGEEPSQEAITMAQEKAHAWFRFVLHFDPLQQEFVRTAFDVLSRRAKSTKPGWLLQLAAHELRESPRLSKAHQLRHYQMLIRWFLGFEMSRTGAAGNEQEPGESLRRIRRNRRRRKLFFLATERTVNSITGEESHSSQLDIVEHAVNLARDLFGEKNRERAVCWLLFDALLAQPDSLLTELGGRVAAGQFLVRHFAQLTKTRTMPIDMRTGGSGRDPHELGLQSAASGSGITSLMGTKGRRHTVSGEPAMTAVERRQNGRSR
jgi:hypothetical protein